MSYVQFAVPYLFQWTDSQITSFRVIVVICSVAIYLTTLLFTNRHTLSLLLHCKLLEDREDGVQPYMFKHLASSKILINDD